ncbi:hypothetical protein C2S51_038934 [Perilla frutescens var. frutescens]|nr:hypothetical protein C2S51_038934 [Perilla frutescens var. frutescens]
MAFSTRRGAGGWAQSLLPTAATKTASKQPRKSRKRTTAAFRDFFISNFFAIGLCLTFAFFLFILFRFAAVPRPLQLRSSASRRPRKPVVHKWLNDTVLAADVDITTKELYDKIQFLDEDGGPWKQGWRVSYKGSEWDEEKLKVFVVPHSHNDPGWKLTVEEYYDKQSRHILDTIVETLSKDNRRKFIWEEMSYLERWWRDASDVKRESFINLAQNGQLEIVSGGWVMNDEANSHYFAIIEQRTHYELKKELAWHKNLEYVWRQSWDSEESTDIFVHMMPFYSYDIPHTCGPEPAVCCQFDFARMRGFVYERCPWGEHPVETDHENVKERALKLLDQYKKKSTLYRTNTLLVPLGDDFRYISIDEAEAQFRNYQLLFDYINSDPSLNAEAKFGTLDDYFRTLREEADRINYSVTGEIGSGEIGGFPSLSGDFFTYADRNQDYWSGYYVSRPFFKAVDRVLEQTLRGAEMMMSFLLGYCQKVQCEKFPTSFSYKLISARRNLALFQHHDGVTGTAKDHVVEDYGTRMHMALQDLQIFMSKAIEVLLGIRHEKNDQHPANFEPAQMRSRYDVQPVHKAISAREGTVQTVVLFNPLEQIRNEVVMVVVERPDVTVLDSNWTCVKSQISPELRHDNNKIFTGRHRLYWKSSSPAMGLQTYYVANGFVGCEKAKPASLRIFSPSKQLSCPAHYACSNIESDIVEISNQHQTLSFSVSHGLLQKISHTDGHMNVVDEEISMYSSTESGAYLFKPNGNADPITQDGGLMVISEGHWVREVYSYPKTKWEKSPISHSTRLYNGQSTIQEFVIEKEYHVELLGHEFNDREIIARYKTDMDNKRIFYTDLNGFQMSRRETYDKIPVQGNYYPMPSLAFMQDLNGERFSVHTKQSLGVGSLKDGWLEIMLDRRLVSDDGRGLGQGVMDNRPMNVVFHILLESNISSSVDPIFNARPLSPSLLSHLVGAHLNYPIHGFIAKTLNQYLYNRLPDHFLHWRLLCHAICILSTSRFLDLRNTLRCPLESPDLLSLCKGDTGIIHTVEKPGLTVMSAKATSINLLHEDAEVLGYSEQSGNGALEGQVLISPMEIQAYKLQLKPGQ